MTADRRVVDLDAIEAMPISELRLRAHELVQARDHGAEAIAVNLRILELAPGDDAPRTNLGYAYRTAGDFDSAETVYRQILENGDAGRRAEIARRALRCIEEERVHGRPRTLDDLLAAVPNANDARLRAAAARDAGNLTVALRWSDRSLTLAESQGRAVLKRSLCTRSSILRRLKRTAEAVEVATRAVQLDADYADNGPAYRTLAAALVDAGDVEEAIGIAERLLEPDVGDAYAQNAAGRALREGFGSSGDVNLLERSERCYRRAARLDDAGPEPLRALEEIHRLHARAGRTAETAALAAFLARLGREVRRARRQTPT
jgi:tetratricopeptide (TPR) repeat protein